MNASHVKITCPCKADPVVITASSAREFLDQYRAHKCAGCGKSPKRAKVRNLLTAGATA